MTGANAQLEHAELLLDRRDANVLPMFHAAEISGADPDRCSAGRWMAHMLAGDFASAWRESDAIRRRGGPDPHRMWDGQRLDGRRVIVRCLHGLGDAIQFLRYASRLREITSELIVEVPPALFELAPGLDGVDRVVTWGCHSPSEPIAWDAQIELMELPYIFRTEVDELPIAERYLRPPRAKIRRIASMMGTAAHRRIGVVWAAGEWNPSRSIPFTHIRSLVAQPGCEYWNLQGGEAQKRWSQLPHLALLRDSADFGPGVMNLACTIANLDLVITVDTLAAHLAGAIGIPAWVLLEYAADWRWMHLRTSSPWYPSLRLFRQPSPGDWQGVIHEVQKELSRWTQHSGRLQHIA